MTEITLIYFYLGLALFDLILEIRHGFSFNWQRQTVLFVLLGINLAALLIWSDEPIPLYFVIISSTLFMLFNLLPYFLSLGRHRMNLRAQEIQQYLWRFRLRYALTFSYHYWVEYQIIHIYHRLIKKNYDKAEALIHQLKSTARTDIAKRKVAHALFSIYGSHQQFYKIVELAEQWGIQPENETDSQAMLWLVRAYSESGNIDRAHQYLVLVQHQISEILLPNRMIALLWFIALMGDTEGVQLIYNRFKTLFEVYLKDIPYLYDYWMGRAFLRKGDYPSAETYFNKALDRLPPAENFIRPVVHEYLEMCHHQTPLPMILDPNLEYTRYWHDWLHQTSLESLEPREMESRRKIDLLSFTTIAPLVLIVIFTLLEAFGQYDQLLKKYNLFHWGVIQVLAVEQGDWWRWVTASFLHFDATHLFFNVLGLFMLSWMLEHAYGRVNLISIFVLSAIVGNIISYAMAYREAEMLRMSLGSSGGVMGLLGCVSIYLLNNVSRVSPSRRRFLIITILCIVLYSLVYGFIEENVDNYAHIGGLIFGAFLALILPQVAVSPKSVRKKVLQARIKGSVFVLSLLCVGYGAVGLFSQGEDLSNPFSGRTVDKEAQFSIGIKSTSLIHSRKQEKGLIKIKYECTAFVDSTFLFQMEAWKKEDSSSQEEFESVSEVWDSEENKVTIGRIPYLQFSETHPIRIGESPPILMQQIVYTTKHKDWFIHLIFEIPDASHEEYRLHVKQIIETLSLD